MKNLESLNNIVRREKQTSTKKRETNPTGYEVSSFGQYMSPTKNKSIYLNEMRSWVYSAVSVISDEIGAIQIKLLEKKGDEIVEVTEHPALDVLFKVNDFTTKFDHFWLTTSYLELTGESPWFVEKENGQPSSLFFLRPDRITPIPNKQKVISGYKYRLPDGDEMKLEVDEVIFLKYPDPANPFRGLSVLEAASQTVDIDNQSEKWNFNFYKNSARPDVILKVKDLDSMTKEQRDRLKRSLERTYGETENAHKAMVLWGNMDIDKLSSTQKDMDFMEQSKFTRDKILGIFRVPKSIVAQTDGVNLANSKTAIQIFERFTIKPKMDRIIQQLNEFYLPMFAGTENMYLDFESPVPEDDVLKLERDKAGIASGWLTINEVRASEGLESIPGLDVPYINGSLVPAGQETPVEAKIMPNKDSVRSINARNKGKINYLKAFDKLEDGLKKLIYKKLKKDIADKKYKKLENDAKEENKPNQLTKEEKVAWWEKKNVYYEKYQTKVENKQTDIFKDQEKKVLTNLNKQYPRNSKKESLLPVKVKQDEIDIDKVLLDVEEETKIEVKYLVPLLLLLYKESGDQTFGMLDLDETIDMDRPFIKKKITADVKLAGKEVTKTTNKLVSKEINAGIANNEGIGDITKRIQNVFKSATTERSKMISETEVGRINNEATEQAFIDSGVVEAKQWQINPGACPICVPLQGKIVNLGKDFFKKGDTTTRSDGKEYTFDYDNVGVPPAHPRCKCNLVPILIKEKEVPKKENIEVKEKIVVLKNTALEEEYIAKLEELNKQIEQLKKTTKKMDKDRRFTKKRKDEVKKELEDIRAFKQSLIDEYNENSDAK